MKYLRRIYGVTRLDKIKSTQIREDLEIKSVEEYIEERQLGWWGHVQRMKKKNTSEESIRSKDAGKEKKRETKENVGRCDQ